MPLHRVLRCQDRIFHVFRKIPDRYQKSCRAAQARIIDFHIPQCDPVDIYFICIVLKTDRHNLPEYFCDIRKTHQFYIVDHRFLYFVQILDGSLLQSFLIHIKFHFFITPCAPGIVRIFQNTAIAVVRRDRKSTEISGIDDLVGGILVIQVLFGTQSDRICVVTAAQAPARALEKNQKDPAFPYTDRSLRRPEQG